jgi:hypothetical protein
VDRRHQSLVGQSLRSDLPIGILHDLGNLVPIRLVVDPHTHPSPIPDVGRAEEAARIVGDQRLLRTGRRRTPKRESICTVVMIIQHDELPLAPHEPARPAVAVPLADPG